ncbi:hypothetical protein EDC04DRAFT_3097749 [Pisolithus marmoratus]|nr:hypothetical protein EDC04DRAFT_3097749 [Pisolithus marmoratus]
MDFKYFDCDLDCLWLAWVSVASLVALASQYTLNSLYTPMPPKVCVPKASWNDQEVGSLQIHYLHEHWVEVGDNGNFKSSMYKSAAEHISKHLTSGPVKTTAMVRNKWVSHGKFNEAIFEDYAKTHLTIHPFKYSGWEYMN